MSERKSNLLIPALGAAVLVVVGGVAAYFYFNKPTGGALTPLASAKVVPSEALMVTYISTDPQVWGQLQQFGTPEAQQAIAKGLENFNQESLAKSNVNYEQDLKPWVGSIMVAVMPPNPGKPVQDEPKSKPESNFLLVVGIKDKVSALKFYTKVGAEKDPKIKKTNYKGVEISESENKGKPAYTAVLNDYLVLSGNQKTLENAVDTFKGDPSFASKEGAGNILAQGVDVQNPIAQFYLPEYGKAMEDFIKDSPNAAQFPPETLQQLKQVKSVVAGIGIDQAGLRMKAIANLDPTKNKFEYQPSPGKIVSQLPADTLGLITGQGISRYWSAIVEEAKTNPTTKSAIDQARQQVKTVNLDLDKDVFGWMDDEFAIAAIPSNQGILAQVGFGGALVFKTSDRATAEATLKKLDDLVKNYSLAVVPRTVDGKSVTEWQIPSQGALLGHGWLDEKSVFIALGGPIVDVIATKPPQSLESHPSFKAATDSLPKPNVGYFYIDMDKTMLVVNKFAQGANAIPPEANAVLNSISGIGVTAVSPNKSISQFEVLVALKAKTSK